MRKFITILILAITASALSGKTKIFTIGDSTVQDYDDGYYPRAGWGQVLPHFFDTAYVEVVNKAVGGTSSKSFYDYYWTAVKNSLSAGDFVFIQFGINDASSDEDRYTQASTTFKEYLTKYIEEAQAKGAHPVLVATLRRNAWNSDGTPYDAYHGYPIATRELASEINVPLVDLDVKCDELMTELGKEYVTYHWYMNLVAGDFPNYPSGNSDDVHFQEMGAIEMARLVTEEIQDLSDDANVSTLIPYLKPLRELSVATDNNDSINSLTRTASYPEGATVTLRVKPKGENVVDRWSSLASDSVASDIIIYVTMPATEEAYTAHILYGPDYLDCNGVFKGGAYYDNCGDCVMGNTLALPCKNDFSYDTVKIVIYENDDCFEATTRLTQESEKRRLQSKVDSRTG